MKRTLVTAVAGLGLGSLLVLATGCSTAEPARVHRTVVHRAAPAPPADDTAALKAQLDALQKDLNAAKGGGPQPPAAQPGAQAGPADNKAIGSQYFLQGKAAYEAGDFNHAKDLLAKAVELDPANAVAKKLLDDARLASGELAQGDKGVAAKRELDAETAKVRAQVAEIETRYNRGVRAMNAKEYHKAVEEFTYVAESAKWFPYTVDISRIQNQAKKALEEAKALAAIQDAELARDRERLTQKTAEQEERARFEQRAKRIHQLFEAAQQALERSQFELAESYCNDILAMDPNSFKTEDLKSIIQAARHDSRKKEIACMQLENWRNQFESNNRKEMSQVDAMEFPTAEAWRRISSRKPRGFGAAEQKLSDADQAVVNKMQTTKISLNFTDAPLPDVVTFLREYTRLNILVDESPGAVENPADKKITFHVEELPFDQAFDLILKMLDLAYKIDNGTIIITSKDKMNQETRLELYDVQDLVISLVDFPGPEISLVAPTDQQGGGGVQIEEQASSKPFTGDDLKDLIKNNVAKGTWETAPNSIEFNNGLLIVRHTPATHRAVQKLLNDVRQSTGMVVSIETRFLTVENHFLEEVGVEWRGLPSFPTNNLFSTPPAAGGPFPGSPENQFTYDRDLNGDGTADIISSGFNGTFGNNNELDLRGRVESSLDNDQIYRSFLDNILSNSGGATLSYALIDDVSAEAILRAVHKDERAKLLTAPKIMVYNTQRANVFIARQITYVKSFTIEVATSAVIAKPIPAVVQDGITLDVRPTVSADRRYITMELRPTVARLLQDITQSGLDVVLSVIPVTTQVHIETPDLEVQRARTTVTMPDGGTLLFGGLTDIFDDDTQQEIPFLSQIPIINFFTTTKANAQQRRSLLTLVRAKITIAEEEEKKVGR